MKTITIRELHLKTGRWVRHAAVHGPVVVSDRGRRIAALQPFEAATARRALPDREAVIRKRSRIPVDSAIYAAEDRGDWVIYFDAAHIAKCYLNEPGAERVRELARQAEGLASCEIARVEFASILKRHVRERHLTRREANATLKEFEEDERDGVWQWFGVTSELLERARQQVSGLSSSVFIRSIDALHLTCAAEHGFHEVYTSDRHMLQAAKHFHVVGINILDE